MTPPARATTRAPITTLARVAVAVAAGVTLLAVSLSRVAAGQAPPDPAYEDARPQLHDYVCPPRDPDGDGPPAPRNDFERARQESRARYREYYAAYLARVGSDPVSVLVMPVDGVSISQIAGTFGAPRWDRSHEG